MVHIDQKTQENMQELPNRKIRVSSSSSTREFISYSTRRYEDEILKLLDFH